MNYTVLFLCMLFGHIVDDFVLQAACLNSLKQKSWWDTNAPSKKYRFDYITAMLAHCFCWTFMIMLPILVQLVNNQIVDLKTTLFICIAFIANTGIHYVADNLKVNKHRLSLTADQIIHIIQIFLTVVAFKIVFNF